MWKEGESRWIPLLIGHGRSHVCQKMIFVFGDFTVGITGESVLVFGFWLLLTTVDVESDSDWLELSKSGKKISTTLTYITACMQLQTPMKAIY